VAAEEDGPSWNPDTRAEGDAPSPGSGGSAGASGEDASIPTDGRGPAGSGVTGPGGNDLADRGRVRDIAVLLIGLLTALNLLQYKYLEATWSRHFVLYNTIFLAFLTIFLTVGLLLFLAGVRRLFPSRPRKLVLFIAGVAVASASLAGLLAMRQGSIYGLTLGLLALLGLWLILAGQLEVGRRDAAGILLAILGMSLVTLVPVHEAFGVLPLGDLWAAPNLALMAAGAALACAGVLLVHGAGEPGGRPVASYGLWLTGVMALFLVPFHEAAGINSNSAYGMLDQTLMVTGAIAIGAGVALFVRKQLREGAARRHLVEGDRLYAGGDAEAAVLSYDLALRLEPDLGEAWARRGAALERLGRLEDAQRSLERALSVRPEDHLALAALSAVHRRAGNPGKALGLATLATDLSPSSEVAWNNRANALADLRRPDEALVSYERAVSLNPAYGKAWYNRGVVLLSQGRPDDALECFEEVLGITPGDERALRMLDACRQSISEPAGEG